MKQKDIAALLDEPACAHNKKEKSGCAKPKPGGIRGQGQILRSVGRPLNVP
jgi:nitrogenase molybdenum-cofactor synthesis protein NifE